MNKNTAIGILVAVVVLGGGYALLRNKPVPADVNAPVTVNVNGDTDGTPPGSTVPDTTPRTAGAPLLVASDKSAAWASSAFITSEVNPNGASTTYWYDYGTTTAFGTKTAAQGIGSGYGLIGAPAYITGLKANTLYYFRLSAKNSFATVTGPTYSFSTNNLPPPQGTIASARTLAAANVTRTTSMLAGDVNPGGQPTTYWFEYGTTTNFGWNTGQISAGGENATMGVTASLAGLQPLTKYYYRLNAQNKYGTTNGAVMNFTTKGPAPVTVTAPDADTTAASNIGTTNAQLNGRLDPNGGETMYWFEYGEDSLLGTLIGTGTAQQLLAAGTSTVNVKAPISGLRTKATYYYRLVARNSAGTVRGDIVSFKTR